MRQSKKLDKCPSCSEDILEPSRDERISNGYNCPSCGHRVYCWFCGHPQIQIKEGKWACPFIEGSGLHFGLHSPSDAQKNERWLRENRFEKAGFTLDEYRLAVREWNKPYLIDQKREELGVLLEGRMGNEM